MSLYNFGKTEILNGNIDLTNDTIKAALLDNTYTIDIDNDSYWSDISGYEVSSVNYTSGGQALTNKTITQDNVNDNAVFTASNVSWTSVTFTARFVAIYKDTGLASTSPIVAVIDFGLDQTATAQNFQILWNASGILTLG